MTDLQYRESANKSRERFQQVAPVPDPGLEISFGSCDGLELFIEIAERIRG
jgi:hypothetical protein